MTCRLLHPTFRRHVHSLASQNVTPRTRSAEQNLGVQRIRRRITGFATGTNPCPFMHRDSCMHASRGCANRAAVLLCARYPVWKAVVCGYVIEFSRWLVVPRTPCQCSVLAHDSAL